MSVFSTVHCLLHELMVPLKNIEGACAILRDEELGEMSQHVDTMSAACEQLVRAVNDVREHLDDRLDLSSPVTAASEFRQIASTWSEYEAVMSIAVHNMRCLRAAGFRMVNTELDAIMTKSLFGGLERLRRLLSYFEAVEAEDLASWNAERFSWFLDSPDEENVQ